MYAQKLTGVVKKGPRAEGNVLGGSFSPGDRKKNPSHAPSCQLSGPKARTPDGKMEGHPQFGPYSPPWVTI